MRAAIHFGQPRRMPLLLIGPCLVVYFLHRSRQLPTDLRALRFDFIRVQANCLGENRQIAFSKLSWNLHTHEGSVPEEEGTQ